MSIQKRNRKKGVVYRAMVVTKTGQQISKSFQRKIDAESWEREQRQLLNADPRKLIILANARKTLNEFSEMWLEKYATKNKVATSVKRDRQLLKNQILKYLGRSTLSNISQSMVEDWMVTLRNDQGLAPKTCNNCLMLLKKMLNDAVRWKFLESNDIRHVPGYKAQQVNPSFWTQEEARTFLNHIHNHHPGLYPVFALALYAGLRKGEIRGLQWDCVDLGRKFLLVKRIYCDATKQVVSRTKGKKDRYIPLNQSLFSLLTRAKTELAAGGVFVIKSDFSWGHEHRLMDKLCSEAGVQRIKFHDMRHTFASNLVMSGKTLYDVKELLGHANMSTTEKYAHLSPGYLQGATECLNFEPIEEAAGFANVINFRR